MTNVFEKYFRTLQPALLLLVLTLVVRGGVGTDASSVLQVTSLQAVTKSGQTFLTWDALPGTAIRYNVYRASAPVNSSADLHSAQLLATVEDSSSYDARLSEIVHSPYFFRIDSLQPSLTLATELFVHTTVDTGEFYYAVTRVTGGIEDTTVYAGQNSLISPVHESPGAPAAVWQTVISSNIYVFVHWTDATGHDGYPAMTIGHSYPFHFGVRKRGTDPTHPLVVRPHARGGDFLSAGPGTSNPEEWMLLLDDPIPNDIRNTIWHGYHSAFDLATGDGVPDSGIVIDYTVRRMVWTLDWVLRRFPIDTTRVYAAGGSMGGVGAVFLGLACPSRIAALLVTTPKFDFSIIDDPNTLNAYNTGGTERIQSDRLWGTVETNLPSSSGLPIYDRLNAGFMARYVRRTDLPFMITFNGKNDYIVGWLEKIGFYNAMQESRHGGIFFFDSRSHGGGTREWLPEQVNDVLYRYRLDQSYPAFSYALCNDNPGDGHATDGDTYGTINGHLAWDSDIVDTVDRYEITVRLVNLTSIYGTETPPESTRVDVTLRRLRLFDPHTHASFLVENRDTTGTTIESTEISPDTSGLLTIPQSLVTRAGNRLVVTPVIPPPPSRTVDHTAGWNVISVPLHPVDPRAEVLFSPASSPAFAFSGGYVQEDSLRFGIGYWMKFSDSGETVIVGELPADSVEVLEGWNLVGAGASAVPASGVVGIPGGAISSSFYGYENGYRVADSLRPGRGYWVKASQNGRIVFPSGVRKR